MTLVDSIHQFIFSAHQQSRHFPSSEEVEEMIILYSPSQIMISFKLSVNSIFLSSSSVFSPRSIRFKFETRAFLKPNSNQEQQQISLQKSSVQEDSLKVLEWDKVCDSVASFAGTNLGRESTKEQLGLLNQSYEESIHLLAETNAAVEMLNHGDCGLEFSGIDVALVKSGIQHVSRGEPVDGKEALAVASLLKLSENLQLKVKAAIKQDSDWYKRFMPLSEVIMELVINQSLVKSIQQVIDEDGSVKDSASSSLKNARDQVRVLERKLYQLMDNLIRTEQNETSSLEMSNIDGRWCVKSGVDQLTNVKGLLLSRIASSGSGVGSLIEPLSAIPLNDELLQARSLVAEAEEVVLRGLSEKIRTDLDDIHYSLNSIIQLDIVSARAKYSLTYGGTFPDLFLTQDLDGYFPAEPDTSDNKTSRDDASSHPTQREWTLYLPKAYHPLLIQQHRQNLKKARKDVSNAVADIRRRKFQGETLLLKENPEELLASLEMRVSKLEEAHPVPVDFFVGKRTRVLVITGPNTGGKTICLKTVGLAAMMAKSGLYVLSSEPVRIPWFDAVFADIGDEQSLSQSLSTFSGHLRRISAIQAQSTDKSLVLLDEVGAGTNPLEGAALGMSLLESFAESGAFLTIATTHHGELKTLKYSNKAFENACMEFDEVNLKPTYKILWGIPGSSHAINIAERLGLPGIVIDNARELYGTANAEINQVIIDMEQFKQELQGHIRESQKYISLSRELHGNLLTTKQKITEHGTAQRYRKMKEISEAAAIARSTIHQKLRELRASAPQPPQHVPVIKTRHDAADKRQFKASPENIKHPRVNKSANLKQISPEKKILKVGDEVHVSRLGKTAIVLEVVTSKNEIVVQAGNMKLRLKMSDVIA